MTLEVSQLQGQTRLRNICRIKGQEENVLRGLGLVVGLNGTGEAGDGPTMRALAQAMEVMGSPLSTSGYVDQAALADLRKVKNAAMVMVTATVPATGARRGDKLDCYVSAINGKSLAGGRLAFAALQGPNTQDRRVFALCQGHVEVDDAAIPTVGRIHNGCQMEQDVFTPFYKDGLLTLVIDKNHASFQVAEEITTKITEQYVRYGDNQQRPFKPHEMVRAIDAANIVVRIPEAYESDPVVFASEILDLQIYEAEPEARIFVNPRAGSIVISGNVEIGDVVVTHKNVVIEAGRPAQFSRLDSRQDLNANAAPKLQRLVEQLADLKVPTEDVIEIIRGIDRNGKLHGKLIIE